MPAPRSIPALFLTVALLVGCSSDDTTATGDSEPAAASSTTAAPSTTTTTVPEPDAFAVGRLDVEVVDRSRPTAADPARGLPERPERTIPVIVLFPAEGEPAEDAAPVTGADPADGPFPLVVFSHGVTATGHAYIGRVQHWARAGYVVAAPTYPLSSGPGGLIGDYVNQPDDAHFVVEELLALSERAGHPLEGVVDGDNVGLAGHSLGAITTIGAAYNSCCTESWTDAAVEISGIELPFPEGSYEPWPDTPLLAIHGANDGTVPVGGSESLFQKSVSPSYYLRYSEAGHSDLLGAESGELLDQVVLAFFDRYLKGEAEALDGIGDAVVASGLATFEQRNT